MSETPSSDLRTRVVHLPVIGYLIRLTWFMVRLPKQFDRINALLAATEETTNDNSASLTQLKHRTEAVAKEQNDKMVDVSAQLSDVKHQLLTAKLPKASAAAKGRSDLLADDHDLDDFYIQFENKFRGTEDEIKERTRVYLPILKKLKVDFVKHPALDIGCGRGEFLTLLKENNIKAIGLDLNESMVERCKKQGLEAVQGDALTYLMKQKSGSIGAIVGMHIVEHIPFNFLLRLFEECYRVLAPGGVVIFETPNPESLHVGSFSFYYDPSHLHPLPPDMLAFAIKNRGFDKTEILRLHPIGDGHENDGRDDPAVAKVVERFFMAQDYAVIGRKNQPTARRAK